MSLDEIVTLAMSRNILSEKALNIEGMSGKNLRRLLNTLLSFSGTKYLEIGCWKGSTLYSALYKNNPEYVLAIDNFSEFGKPRSQFHKNMEDVGVAFNFLDKDSFSVDLSKIDTKFNVYFYDGAHSEHDHKMALEYYYNVLEDSFIYICDDWNWEQVRNGTNKAINDLKLNIVEEKVFFTNFQDPETWWNGVWIAKLKKV